MTLTVRAHTPTRVRAVRRPSPIAVTCFTFPFYSPFILSFFCVIYEAKMLIRKKSPDHFYS